MEKSRFIGLECIRCGEIFSDLQVTVCRTCGDVLTGKYDLTGLEININEQKHSIWNYAPVLPPVLPENQISLDEGDTPYIRLENYGSTIGAGNIWAKLEGCNPSGSFKDRAASIEVSLAKQWKCAGIFTASSGNAAAALAAFAARARLKCLILVREDSTISKLEQISAYNPRIVRVKKLFTNKQTLMESLKRVETLLPGWRNGFVWAPFNPLAADGVKIISYEISSKKVPDYVFVPTAGGDLLFSIFKGFSELKNMNLIDKMPKIVTVQGDNASPLVQALERNLDHVEETGAPSTIAGALRVNFGANHAIKAVKESGGFGISVSDREIENAQRNLAKLDGIFAETSSAAALAGVEKAIRNRRIEKDATISVILTGTGFKEYQFNQSELKGIELLDSVNDLKVY